MQKLKINNQAASWILVLLVFGVFWVSSFIGTLDGTPTEYIRCGEAAFFSLVFWLLLFALVRQAWVVLLLCLPAALLIPIEIWLRSEFGTPTSVQSIALALETSWSEIANFLMTYGEALVGFWLAWILIYGIAIWFAYQYRLRWTHRTYVWCLIIFPFVILFFYISSGMPPWIQETESVDAFDGKTSQGWYQKWEDIFPVNIVIALQRYELEKKKVRHVQSDLQHQSMHGQLTVPDKAPEVVVLVIGESSTATRWSLLGYPRQTTPRLQTTDNLIAFTDVVGLSVATRTAVPGVLSRRPVLRAEGTIDVNAEPSLLKAFGEAGYQTHWFSNQSPFGKFDTSITVYAREAQDVRFLNPSNFEFKGSLDEILLDPLRAILKTPGRHFIVLHTLGSHFNYAMRYPDKFDTFKPSLKDALFNFNDEKEKKERVGNSYDNSILYTDYILSEIINSVNKHSGSTMVAYFSDHGVDLPNDQCRYLENARKGEAAFRVPALFWMNNSMREKHDSEWKELQSNKTQPYTTHAMFSTLLQLSNISISGELPREDFLTRPNISKKSRDVAVGLGLVNFDTARLKNACIIHGD